MWLLLFVILLLVIFGKLLSFALKAAWSITKILFSVVIFPLVLIMLVVAGLMYVAGVSSLSQNIRATGSFSGGYNVKAGGTTIHLEIFRNQSVQEPNEYVDTIGNPCMKTRNISGLSGYCQTEDFQVSGNMLDTEKSEINNLMNGGVYIE